MWKIYIISFCLGAWLNDTTTPLEHWAKPHVCIEIGRNAENAPKSYRKSAILNLMVICVKINQNFKICVNHHDTSAIKNVLEFLWQSVVLLEVGVF